MSSAVRALTILSVGLVCGSVLAALGIRLFEQYPHTWWVLLAAPSTVLGFAVGLACFFWAVFVSYPDY